MLTQQRSVSMHKRLSADDDDYEDWKQIDGIFSSMGVNGQLSEESFLTYLKKDAHRNRSIGDWLTGIGLGQYENVFVVNGYDNINMLNGGILEVTELELMGFVNKDDISTILQQIKKLPSMVPIDTNCLPASVDEWLSSLDLSQYIDNFYNMDYTTMAWVLQIWEVELVTVLSVVLLGHQKRILVSLGDNRVGVSTLRRQHRENISDISQVFQVNDIRVDVEDEEYSSELKYKEPLASVPLSHTKFNSPAMLSLHRSDSGCSIGSDGTRPDTTETIGNVSSMSSTNFIGYSLPKNVSTNTQHNESLLADPSTDATTSHSSLAGYDRSQMVKQLTSGNVFTHTSHAAYKKHNEDNINTATVDPSIDSADSDYANISADVTAVSHVGNIEALKLSKKSHSKKVHRPLPQLPQHVQCSPFTVDDLPPGFSGKHNPKKLISGCINYMSCYLGTGLVGDITGPESTRGAIAKLKQMSESVSKLPAVTLSISFRGVRFINDINKHTICEHEITNIYCAAQDSVMLNYFAYITKDVLTQGLYCHVFCAQSQELAREVIMTLGEAFDIAYYATHRQSGSEETS